MKNIAFALLIATSLSCSQSTVPTMVENVGNAQGSTYQIKYLTTSNKNYSDEIEQIFEDIDQSMSTYKPESIISSINQGDNWINLDEHFTRVLTRSLEIAEESDGAFDPTVGRLVSLWGFGLEKRGDITDAQVQETKALVGYQYVEQEDGQGRIPSGFTIDFNSIAQGYTVDVLGEYLEGQGITDYMVEVGGEVRARGVNDKGQTWRIGIDKPSEEIDYQDRFQVIISLENASLATSGSYRKFWVDEETGIKYAHTIDPETGYPAKNQLLSASIISSSGMDADGYATVCLVYGLEKCMAFLDSKEDLEGYLVYTDEQGNWETTHTEGFDKYIVQQ